MIRLPGSIRLNLMLVVLAAALPMMVMVIASGVERRNHELAHLRRTTMRLADYFARQQNAEAARLQTILASLAEQPAVRALDAPACDALFRDLLIGNPGYVNFALMAADGEALASALPFTRQNLSDRKEFQEALHTGRFAVGEYAVGKVSGKRILPFAYPVRDDGGAIRGVLIATLLLRDLTGLFDISMLPEGSFVGLTDKSGVRLYRYPAFESAAIGKPIAPNVWNKMREGGDSPFFIETGTDGIRRIYTARKIALADQAPYLDIFVAIPEQTALAHADAVTRRDILWFAASLTLSVFLALLVGKYGIHEPLVRIARTARRLGEGDLTARSGLTESRGSLGLLALSMDRMAQNLEVDRTALVKARDELDLEAKRRAALMNVSGEGIVIIDEGHRIVEANSRFAQMLGYAPEELPGMYTWQYEGLMTKEMILRDFQRFTEVRRVFETLHRRKDGTVNPVEVSAFGSNVLGKPFVFAVVRDIAERKESERALLESEERYRTLFENSMDAIALHEGVPPRFSWVNPAFCKLFGYEPEEIYAMDDRQMLYMLHESDRAGVRESLNLRLSGEVDMVRRRFRIRRKTGEVRWVDMTGRRLRLSDKRMSMSIYRDVTEEHETRELLALAKTRAEAASRSKSEFLANMSHEIRTPLNGVMGMLRLLEDSGLGEEQKKYARMAIQSSRRLTRLLSDILDISRIEAGKMVVARAPFRMRGAVEEVLELLRPVAEQSEVACSVFVDPRIPDQVAGDAARLQQILTNLAGNALKFTRRGSVDIELHPLLTNDEKTVKILFSVADTGAGIPADQLGMLFEPFTQGSQGYQRDHQGAGLGLAICKRLAGLMGGEITVESEPGEGTTMLFCLPFALAEDAALDSPASVSERTSLTGLKTLLAEDDALSQLATRLLLERCGCRVTAASDGAEALRLLTEEPYDIVFMDIQMPVMDGVEAVRRIRMGQAGADRAATPIVALTAYAMTGDKETFLGAGMDGYVSKPVDDEKTLREIIAKAMAVRRTKP